MLLIPTAYAGKIGAPYAPTRLPAVKKAFDWAGLNEHDILVDLGAGDGKILLEARRRGATALGYELSPIMWLITWLRLRISGDQADKVKFANFYNQTLPPNTTHIFAFLMPNNMARVAAFLKKQTLSPQTLIFIYAFPFNDAEPLTVIRAQHCAPLYIYELRAITKPQ